MKLDIPALIEKWSEIYDDSDDWTEKNLATEIVDDLKAVLRG